MEIMSPKKKKKKTKTTTTTSYVPNDIIIDILSWVPANSLLQLRWACKYWFHLITRDHDFIMKQFHRSQNLSVLISKPLNAINHKDYSYQPFRIPSTKPCKIFQYYIDYSTKSSIWDDFCGATTNPILSGIFDKFDILGSCHGLILFSYYCREQRKTILCIWNPCTKEYKYLPEPKPYGFNGYHPYGVQIHSIGLGYDHSIEDYKVIRNVKSFDGSIQFQIYTLRTNSWRYIGSFTNNNNIERGFFGFIGNGVFVNGALHFIYNEGAHYPGGAKRILSLDFEKEMYVEISNQPECLNDKAKSIQGPLAIFEGSLCLTMYTTSFGGYKTSIEAWVMKKDYNMNNNNNNKEEYSWSKLYEIPLPHNYGLLISHYHILQPLRFTKDGEIMLLDGKEGLLLFDPKNNKITIHKVYELHPIEQAATTTVDIHRIEVILIYIESLVSLNSGTYIDEKIIGGSNYEYDVDEW